MSKKVNVVYVETQAQLSQISNERGSVRVGSTSNPSARASSYAHEGYRGTMYVAPTNNMRMSEDRLLRNTDTRHNSHRYSNAAEEKGELYVFQGQKRERK